MASERSNHDDNDPLERTELARRLRRMTWPPAPPEVKARVLDRIVSQSESEFASDGDGSPPNGSSAD